jgi:hypothetical protein
MGQISLDFETIRAPNEHSDAAMAINQTNQAGFRRVALVGGHTRCRWKNPSTTRCLQEANCSLYIRAADMSLREAWACRVGR